MFNRKNFYILALALSFVLGGLGQLIKSPEKLLAQSSPVNKSPTAPVNKSPTPQPSSSTTSPVNKSPTAQPSSATTSKRDNLSLSINIIVEKSLNDKKYLQAAQIQLEAEAMKKRHDQADKISKIYLGQKIFVGLVGVVFTGIGIWLLLRKIDHQTQRKLAQSIDELNKEKLNLSNQPSQEELSNLIDKLMRQNKTLIYFLVRLSFPGYFLCIIGIIFLIIAVFYNPAISLQDERIYISGEIEPNPPSSP